MYLGVWVDAVEPITITSIDEDSSSLPISYEYKPVTGANLIPVSGLIPDANNKITLESQSFGTVDYFTQTAPLPPSDSATVTNGFPVSKLTVLTDDTSLLAEGLYFSTSFFRYNYAYDHNGVVRWYTTNDIPAFNMVRIANGNFLTTASNVNNNLDMYEFDIIGRVHRFYILDNSFHHSIWQMPDGNIMATSQHNNGREDELPEDRTNEDGVSIVDLSTGLEVAYYDMIYVMDFLRQPRPYGEVYGEDNVYDWLHLNQSYLNTTNNLIISSSRHQSAVFGVDATTSALAFVMATHEGWDPAFNEYLLTPVDETGAPLYDFSKQEDIDLANAEFWTWGQHHCVEIANDTPNIVEFIVFDNGNFRSRDDSKSVLPNDNYSRTVQYRINLSDMTVMKLYEYGQEVGNRGYSSFVCANFILDNGNIVIMFGGRVIDENERVSTVEPGLSDIIDPLEGSMAQGTMLLQEINPNTGTLLFEMEFIAGYFKDIETYGRWDLSAFRVYKMDLYP